MAAARQRITVLVTRSEKARITEMAKKVGVSRGEYLRRVALTYCLPVEEVLLVRMIEEMDKSTVKASTAVDDALAFVEASNRRIAEMERREVIMTTASTGGALR